jgi:DNA (cytosine-5)-methyltransferase 1
MAYEKVRYFSTFSGIGGFECGIERAYDIEHAHLRAQSQPKERAQGRLGAAHEPEVQLRDRDGSAPLCVGFSEIDRYAVQIYQRHFPYHRNYGDITKINETELPDFDLLVGGFPCQAFSIAGKRGGFSDTRGTLFFDLARILKAKRPRLFLFENVKGLLSHDEGRTFLTIVSALDELGYDLQWEVLNSKNFGVPQNRERIFITGHLRGTPRPQVFPLGEDGGEHNALVGKQAQATGTINSSMSKGGNRQDSKAGVLIGELHAQNPSVHQDYRVYETDGIAPTLNSNRGGGSAKHPYIAQSQIRRLTPMECERLQGYPDGWTEGVSDTQRYKTLGNAVTVNVVEAICRSMLTV